MVTHSSILAWKIPWTEEPGRLQSMGSLRVGHDWVTSLSLFTFMHWRRKLQPTPVFLPWESQGRGSLVGCGLWGRTRPQTWLKSQTRLKRFSSSSSIYNLTIDPENFHNHLWISCHLWPSLLQALWEVNQESQCGSWCSSLGVDCSISLFLPCFWRWGLCKINEVDFATTYTWIWTPSSNICYLCGLASYVTSDSQFWHIYLAALLWG